MNDSQINKFIELKELYPEEQISEENFIKIIQRLSLTDSLFFCSRILIVLYQTKYVAEEKKFSLLSKLDKQVIILNFLHASISDDSCNNFDTKILPDLRNENRVIFFPGQIIELMRWLIRYGSDKENDGQSFESNELRTDFFKALLFSSYYWSEFANQDLKHIPKNEACLSKSKCQSLRTCRLSNYAHDNGPSFSPDLAMARGNYFFNELLPSLPACKFQYKEFSNSFKKTTGFTLSDYQDSIALLVFHQFILPTPDQILFKQGSIFNIDSIVSKLPKFQNSFKKYVKLEAQTKEELKKDSNDFYDFMLSLRRKPLLKTNDERLCILSPVFFIERATVGPLFIVAKADPKNTKKIFGTFGHIFEKYVNEVLTRISHNENEKGCSNNLIFEDDKDKNPKQLDCIWDFYNEICFIETKSIWIKDKELYKSATNYLNELEENYCDPQNGGIYQLANKIKTFVNKEWGEKEYPRVKVIYPILIIHNRFDDSINHSWFFNKKFFSLLSDEPEAILELNGFIIKPLILITVDLLESLETLDKILFTDILNYYDNTTPDRNISFHNFLASDKSFNKLLTVNEFLHQKVIETIKKFSNVNALNK